MESREVIIYSGNILNKAISLPKGSESSNDDELYESLRSVVAQKQEPLKSPSEEPLNGNALEVFAEVPTEPVPPGDRQDLKVTSKLFLYGLQRKDIISAIDRGLRCTSANFLDNLVISFSSFSQSGSLTLDLIQTAWNCLEDQVHCGKVKTIGLSDVDTQLFINLHQLATVKPGIVQINLASCCVVPPELAEFCKLNGIQLLTHKDTIDVLPTPKITELSSLVNSNIFLPPASSWKPNWVLRIQVHLKTRGVLATKSYIASLAEEDIPSLKNN